MVSDQHPLVPLLHQDVSPAAGISFLFPLDILVDRGIIVIRKGNVPEDTDRNRFDRVQDCLFGFIAVINEFSYRCLVRRQCTPVVPTEVIVVEVGEEALEIAGSIERPICLHVFPNLFLRCRPFLRQDA